MAIRLGTVAAIGFEQFPPAEWLGCFRELGCRVVQAYRNHKINVSVEEMLDAIAAGEMPCDSLHGVYGEAHDPSSPDEDARTAAVDTFKAEGELALRLGGSLVVVHCATIREKGVSLAERRLRLEHLGKSMRELGKFGRKMGVQYAFENLPGYHAVGWDVGELAGTLRAARAPHTGMCFDTGHANMVGDAAVAASQTAGQMIYVHLSDNSGLSDDHDMPTYGTLDCDALPRALRAQNYRGTMMLEVFYSVDRLKRLADNGCAEKLARIVALADGEPSGTGP